VGTRGPKPAAAVSGPWVPGERPPPPPELGAVEIESWRSITARLPADFFTAENKPMLKELCRHVRYADELAGDLQAVRATIAEVAAGSCMDGCAGRPAEGRRCESVTVKA
jgi:hypothetical protein